MGWGKMKEKSGISLRDFILFIPFIPVIIILFK